MPNGARYPLVGGTRGRHFDGSNLKPRKVLENAQTPTAMAPAFVAGDRVHAVLGGARVPCGRRMTSVFTKEFENVRQHYIAARPCVKMIKARKAGESTFWHSLAVVERAVVAVLRLTDIQ